MNVKEWIECVRTGQRATHALVIEGGSGSGKSLAIRLLKTTIANQINTVDAGFVPPRDLARTINQFATVTDLLVIDEVHNTKQLDAIKALITADNIAVEVKGVGKEVRTVKANVIITTNFWPTLPDDDRRFIVTSPLGFIAEIIPFLAR